eukprot:582177-Prorocentrum_minimum.AAC.4
MYVPKNSSSGLRASFYLAATWAYLGFRLLELKVLRPFVRSHVLDSSGGGARSVSSTGSTTSTQTRQRAARPTIDPTQTRFQVRKFSDGSCGAEVSGVNLSDMTRAQQRTITNALEENSVLVFQGQSTLGPRRQIGLSQRWGAIVSSRFLPQLPEFPEHGGVTLSKHRKRVCISYRRLNPVAASLRTHPGDHGHRGGAGQAAGLPTVASSALLPLDPGALHIHAGPRVARSGAPDVVRGHVRRVRRALRRPQAGGGHVRGNNRAVSPY